MPWARAVIVYLVTIVLLRLLGRGLQFQSRPYDVAVQVLIGSAAANLILAQELPIWRSFTALGTLALLHTGVSFLTLWNPAKKYLVGSPAVMVENGNFVKGNLIKYQISVEELTAALREKGYPNVSDVEFALLEASGKLSVIPKSQARPVTPKDLKLSTSYEGVSTQLISDGKVETKNLQKLGLTRAWLLSQLVSRGVAGPEDVLFATLDSQGELFVVRQQDVPFLQAILKGVQTQTSPGIPPMVPYPPNSGEGRPTQPSP